MRNVRKSAGIVLIFLVIAVVGITLYLTETLGSSPTPVILISIDTLRADHVGTYGYGRDTTPNLDALASGGVVFERAFAQSPNTAISHATMLTGLRPIVHGCAPDLKLVSKVRTIAEYFKEKGYVTGGFTTHGAWLTRKMGFAQGFDEFFSRFISAEEIHKWVMPFVDTHAGRNFFLFVHYYDVHSDYEDLPYKTGTPYDRTWCADYKGNFTGCMEDLCGSELLDRMNEEKIPVSDADVQYMIDLYDGGIRYTDHQLGLLMDRLKKLDIYDDALILVTADHGEEFREHGLFLHNQFYHEVMHVPLIIKLPGKNPPLRVRSMAGLTDVLPTLLEFAGISHDPVQGVSLLSQAKGGKETDPKRVILSTVKDKRLKLARDVALRTTSHTFITWNKWRGAILFDTRNDPGEKKNVSAMFPKIFAWFRKAAKRLYARDLRLRQLLDLKYINANASPEELEKLKSLGYL